MSLRTGAPIATTETVIVNPNNLKIEGLYCTDKFSNQQLVLLEQDIRDIIPQGLVVNDHDVLTDPAELIRLKSILSLKFEILGKIVQTESKHRVGKVTDFAADDQTLYIQKLYVSQSMLKSISSTQLSIDRDQIIEITDRRIIIKDIEKRSRSGVAAPAPAV